MLQNPSDLRFLTKIILFAISLFYFQLVNALPEDSQQPLHIVADSSQFNYKTGESLYEGNVKVDQGTTHLAAERLTTHNNNQHKIEEAIAYGFKQPAIYTTTPKMGDPVLQAKATTIKFYPLKSTVILEGNVTVAQGENSFNGPIIIYNIKDQFVTAPASLGGRATIMIKPT